MSGPLTWGEGDYPDADMNLRSDYRLAWSPFSQLEGRNGEFRSLSVYVTPS